MAKKEKKSMAYVGTIAGKVVTPEFRKVLELIDYAYSERINIESIGVRNVPRIDDLLNSSF